MSISLQDRFLKSALPPLSNLLNATGICFDRQFDSKCSRLLARFWAFFCFFFLFHCNAMVTVKRTPLLNDFTNVVQNSHNLAGEITNALIRVSALVIDTVTHIVLMLTIWPTIKSLLNILESVDSDLKRPSLLRVYRISLVGLIYSMIMVSRSLKLRSSYRVLNSCLFNHFST